jgi:hypothetical protein
MGGTFGFKKEKYEISQEIDDDNSMPLCFD